jgi:hypothetical protein
MGNKFTMMLVALGIVFVSGWLFGNQIAPPRIQDISAAVWVVCAMAAVMLSAMVSVSR